MFHYLGMSIANVLPDDDDGHYDDGNDGGDDGDGDRDSNKASETRPHILGVEDDSANLEMIAQDIQKRYNFYDSTRRSDVNEGVDPTLRGIEDVKIFRVWLEVRIFSREVTDSDRLDSPEWFRI